MIIIRMPDITPAQIAAVIGWAAAQAVAYGWLTNEQSQLVMSAGATIVAAAWKIADSFLRANRNKAHAAITVAQLNSSSPTVSSSTGYTGPSTV